MQYVSPPNPIEDIKNSLKIDKTNCGLYALQSHNNNIILHSSYIAWNSYSEFDIGDEIYIDDNIDNLFVNGRFGVGVIVSYYDAEKSTKGYKVLYLNRLDFEAPEYDKNGNITGKTIYAKTAKHTKVFDTVRACTTAQELWKAIKGKFLKVVAVHETIGGHSGLKRPDGSPYVHQDGSPYMHPLNYDFLKEKPEIIKRYYNLIMRKIPVFAFAKKSFVFGSDYNPRYFYKDYRIFCDNNNHKWGIRNERTKKIVIKPVFDDIRWGENTFTYYSEMIVEAKDKETYSYPVEYVRFYKNGKKALCKFADLEKLKYAEKW